jgi:hypothetical protein
MRNCGHINESVNGLALVAAVPFKNTHEFGARADWADVYPIWAPDEAIALLEV